MVEKKLCMVQLNSFVCDRTSLNFIVLCLSEIASQNSATPWPRGRRGKYRKERKK